MTLGRTADNKIKIKTDGGATRAVECACCGSCSIGQAQIDWLKTVTGFQTTAPFKVGPSVIPITISFDQGNYLGIIQDAFGGQADYPNDGSTSYNIVTGSSQCEFACGGYWEPWFGAENAVFYYYCPDGSNNPTYTETLDDYEIGSASLGFFVNGNELTGGFAEHIGTVVCDGGEVLYDVSFQGCGMELFNRLKYLLVSPLAPPP